MPAAKKSPATEKKPARRAAPRGRAVAAIKKEGAAQKPYDGWLVSDCFFKRSFAVFGHAFFAEMLICGVLLLVLFLVGLVVSLTTATSFFF